MYHGNGLHVTSEQGTNGWKARRHRATKEQNERAANAIKPLLGISHELIFGLTDPTELLQG